MTPTRSLSGDVLLDAVATVLCSMVSMEYYPRGLTSAVGPCTVVEDADRILCTHRAFAAASTSDPQSDRAISGRAADLVTAVAVANVTLTTHCCFCSAVFSAAQIS